MKTTIHKLHQLPRLILTITLFSILAACGGGGGGAATPPTASTDASLTNLVPSASKLSPEFKSDVLEYTLLTEQKTITVTPTVSQANATVTVNGTKTESGKASQSIELNPGENIITIIVTATDDKTAKTAKTYKITVTRIDLSTNANLGSLALSSGNLNPSFASNVTDYTVTTTAETTTVTPTVDFNKATVTVNGTATDTDVASAPIDLTVGENTITLIVTAEDTSTKTYTITVTRIAVSTTDASLSSIVVSAGSLNPVFASDVTDYTISTKASSTTVTPYVSQPGATVTVNGTGTDSGSTSAPIDLTVGKNIITLIVTAEDTTTKTYSITVTRTALSTDANLSGLALSTGSLNTAFDSNTITYTANTKAETITVTPTVSDDANATVTVNGTATDTGVASAPIDLIVGDNTINVIVTAEDTTTKTYSITVTRTALSTDANLSGLALSTGSLNTAFDSNTITYTANTKAETITVTPTVSDGTYATVTVNGTATDTGVASAPIDLIVGDNTINVIVTAEDTTTKTYSITVTRTALSTDANLSGLALSTGSLNTAFDSNTITYTANTKAETITVTPTVSDGTYATVTVNGTATDTGVASAPIDLTVGDNTINVIVTAEDTTTKAYSITVTLTALSTDAKLSNLVLSTGSLNTTFDSNTITYTANTKAETITVTPTVSDDANATVTVNGTTTVSGSASAPIDLTVGENTITLIVTAEDTTTKTYSITVTRTALSTDANLSNLALSTGSLNTAFTSDVTNYTLTTNASTITITPTLSDKANARVDKVTLNNATISSGSAIELNEGKNTVIVTVVAEDKSTKPYSIEITYIKLSSDTSLSNLVLSADDGSGSGLTKFGSEVITGFDSNTTKYTLTTTAGTTTVTPTVRDTDKATVKVNGTTTVSGSASASIDLTVGENNITTITVIVTAEDKSTQTYSITVTYIDLAADASLQSLTVSSRDLLSPAFESTVTAYTLSTTAENITVTPTVRQANATVTVNGTTTVSGSASASIGLDVGENTITLIVTATDTSTTQTYSITVTRIAVSDTDASLSSIVVLAGSLTTFGSDVTDYTVSTKATTATVTPYVSQPEATVTINGTTIKSGDASTPIDLDVGDNTITLIVTAADGTTTKPYSIEITRIALSTDANLSNLVVDDGDKTNHIKEFKSDVTDYDPTSTNKDTITVTPTVSDANATVEVTLNTTTISSGSASKLNEGKNTITVTVTAENGDKKPYSIEITYIKISSDASLSNLALSAGSFNLASPSNITTYTVSTKAETTTVTPTVNNSKATFTITVNGNTVEKDTTDIDLNMNANTITVTVTAEDGTTKTYSITVTRLALSTDANLSGLVLSTGSLNTAFDSNTIDYTVSTKAKTITVTPTLSDEANATVTVNGTTTDTGVASALIDLDVGGDNTINVTVTAEDGIAKKTYSIKITRVALSNDVKLSNLVLSADDGSGSGLTEVDSEVITEFKSNITAYKLTTKAEKTTITPTLSDEANASFEIKVNDNIVEKGTDIELKMGDNKVTVTVTAENGSILPYTIAVTRILDTAKIDASLSGLRFSGNEEALASTLIPPFDKNDTDPNKVTEYKLFTTANGMIINYNTSQGGAQVSIDNGPALDPKNAYYSLNRPPLGSSVSDPLELDIIVTAPDLVTTKRYKLTIIRTSTESLELLDPDAAANHKFGQKVVQLGTSGIAGAGNIVVHAPGYDINKGAVYLYEPTSSTYIGKFYGDNAGDQLGSGGIIALANNNFLIVSPFANNGAGSVILVNGTNGNIMATITGSSANDRLANRGITLLNNNQFVITSSNYKNDNRAAGSVQVINAEGVIIKTLYGSDYGITNLGDKGVTALSNGDFVIVSSNYKYNTQDYAGIVQLVQLADSKEEKDVVIDITGQGTKANEKFGGDGIFPLKNGNFLIATHTHNATKDGLVLTNAGEIQLINGTDGKTISRLVGDKRFARLGTTIGAFDTTTAIATLGNSNYVVMLHYADNGSIRDAGSVRLFSGVDGTQVGGDVATVQGNFVDDFEKYGTATKITALNNHNYIISAPYNDKTIDGNTTKNVGSIRLMNGTTGAKISEKHGDSPSDLFGSGDVIELKDHKYVVSSPSYNNKKGSVTLFNKEGTLEGTLIGNSDSANFSSGGLTALGNNKFVIASPNESNQDGTVTNAGSIRLVDGNLVDGKVKQISVIYGDKDDSFGNNSVSVINNFKFVFAAPNDDVNGIAGSVQVVNGTTGAVKKVDKIVDLKQDDMESVQIIRFANPYEDYFILSQPLADDNGENSGKVLVVPTL